MQTCYDAVAAVDTGEQQFTEDEPQRTDDDLLPTMVHMLDQLTGSGLADYTEIPVRKRFLEQILKSALVVHSAQLRPVHALKRIAQLRQIQFQFMTISNDNQPFFRSVVTVATNPPQVFSGDAVTAEDDAVSRL